MRTVKIYKGTCTKSVMMSDQGTGFGLYPWGQNTDSIQGYDDGGQDYILPEGYEIARTKDGQQAIYHGDNHCEIVRHSSGRPQLISGDPHNMPVLITA